MAKITIEYDTKDKTCSIKQDGEEVPDCHGVYIGKRYSYDSTDPDKGYSLEIMTSTVDPQNGLRKQTRLIASQNGDLQPQDEGVSAKLVHDILDYRRGGRG